MPDATLEPIVVSWSEISSYRACHHKHKLEYRERWTKTKALNSALGKGTLFHAVLEAYYLGRKARKSLDECVAAAYAVLEAVPTAGEFDQEAVDTVRWMFEGYHDVYRGDMLWSIEGVEYKFKVKLPVVIEGQPNLWLKGSIDLMAKDEENRLIVLDHKTSSVMPRGKKFEMSDQFGLYLWALNQLGIKPWAAMHNAVKSKRNKGDIPGAIEEWEAVKEAGGRPGAKPKMQALDDRFARRFISRTPHELDTLAREAAASISLAYLNPQFTERNPNEDMCEFMCSFRDACLEGRRYGRDWEREALVEQGFIQNFQRH